MSLDVYLRRPGVQSEPSIKSEGSDRIFIRENGATREISLEEWYRRFPDRDPVVIHEVDDVGEVYSANITHNLGEMAAHADLYMPLWRPDEMGIKTAQQLIDPLRKGLEMLKGDPDEFRKYNPKNGWGSYESFIEFVEGYLLACIDYPDAEVSVWR